MMTRADCRWLCGVIMLIVAMATVTLGGPPGIAAGSVVGAIGAGIVRAYWEV